MQFLINVLHVSGVEDRGAESGGEEDHPEVQFAEIEEETEIEIETVTGIGIETGNAIGKEKGTEKEGLDVQEEHPRKGRVGLGGGCN